MGMLSNRFVDEWPFSPQFILSTAGSSAPTAASAPGSLSDPLCTNPGTQTALNCSGAQAANYPTFPRDRKSTRLNSSHGYISYAVFCLKKKKKKHTQHNTAIYTIQCIQNYQTHEC